MRRRRKREKNTNRSKDLVVKNHPKSIITESYRLLRTNLDFLSPDKDLKAILVTSGNPDEGKSSSVGNLGVSMAQAGKKVLLIDGDLRKPMMHRVFEVPNFEGLTNVLTGEEHYNDVIQKTDVENLFVLSAGVVPPNPAELLGSQKMNQLIEDAKTEYDILLIDTAPVIPVPDALILGAKVDGVLLLVRYNDTKRDQVNQAVENLLRVNAVILGTVLTRYPIKSSNYYYYYY